MFKTMGKMALILALAAGAADAQQTLTVTSTGAGGPQQQKKIVRMRTNMMEKLNLTDQQKEGMQKLRIEMQKKNTPILSQIRLARLEIQQLMMAENPDKAKIEAQMKEISGLELKVKLNALDHQFAVRNLLTPEQRKIWKEGRRGGFMGGMEDQMRRFRFYRQGGPLGEADIDLPVDAPIEIEEEIEVN
jgi:Spy/CpxP family protein refolding chaperone